MLTRMAVVCLALGASLHAQSNPLFISSNVMTGLIWHAAKTPGDGTSGSCSVTSSPVQYFSAPFFTDTTADSYSLSLYYESFQAGYVYLYEGDFDPQDPCHGLFVFGLAPLANIDDIHLEAGKQYTFVTSEAELFGGGGSFQVTIEGPAGSLLFLGEAPGCGTDASADVYGAGKAGTLGIPMLASLAPPVLGDANILTISNGLPGGHPVALFAGFESAALPFDGGILLLTPAFTLFLPALDSSGSASLAVELPTEAALCGHEVFFQGAFMDPGAAGTHHIALTHGLHWVLGG